jgi:hypothetical protein
MRKLFTLLLATYLLAFMSPFLVLAEDTEESSESTEEDTEDFEFSDGGTVEVEANPNLPPICPFGKGIDWGTYTKETYENFTKSFNAEMEEANGKAKCGEPNDYSKYLEKGDCSADGKVVTEITEVIAPDVTIEDGEVLTVYAGLCCLFGEKSSDKSGVAQCHDTRTLYTTDSSEGAGDGYSKCTSAPAVNCEKRQWVIGSSGIAVVKVMVKQIFTFAAVSVGTICVGTLIFQGIRISVSGVSGDISEAKNKILQALSGLVLLFLSGLFLYAINPGFFS